MSNATLLELADRVEKASGPDRELDAKIALALGLPQSFFGEHFGTPYVDGPEYHERDKAMWSGVGKSWSAPHYTASLDAVRTLGGLCVFASDIGADGLACVKLVADTSTTPVIEHTGIAPRLEHAWLAAALLARAQQESSDADQ
jgi:hypothetical protein